MPHYNSYDNKLSLTVFNQESKLKNILGRIKANPTNYKLRLEAAKILWDTEHQKDAENHLQVAIDNSHTESMLFYVEKLINSEYAEQAIIRAEELLNKIQSLKLTNGQKCYVEYYKILIDLKTSSDGKKCQSFSELHNLAEKNFIPAIIAAAQIRMEGLHGCKKDLADAAYYLEKEQTPEAKFLLGEMKIKMYDSTSKEDGQNLLIESANENYIFAQNFVGLSMLEGINGFDQNIDSGIKYLKNIIQYKEFYNAKKAVADLYYKEGKYKNIDMALKIYEQLFEDTDCPKISFSLAKIYLNLDDTHVPKNFKKGKIYLDHSASKGEKNALFLKLKLESDYGIYKVDSWSYPLDHLYNWYFKIPQNYYVNNPHAFEKKLLEHSSLLDDHPESNFVLCQYYYETERSDQAKKHCNKAINTEANSKGKVSYLYSLIYQEEIEIAEELAQDATALRNEKIKHLNDALSKGEFNKVISFTDYIKNNRYKEIKLELNKYLKSLPIEANEHFQINQLLLEYEYCKDAISNLDHLYSTEPSLDSHNPHTMFLYGHIICFKDQDQGCSTNKFCDVEGVQFLKYAQKMGVQEAEDDLVLL